MSAFELDERVPGSVALRCGRCPQGSAPPTQHIEDEGRKLSLCTRCGIVVEVLATQQAAAESPLEMTPAPVPMETPEPARPPTPPPPPGPAASPGEGPILDEVWVVQFEDAVSAALRDRFTAAGWAGEVSGLPTPQAFVTAAVQALEAGRKPGLVIMSGDASTLDALEAALGLRAVEPLWGLGPIPLVVYTTASADDELKAMLTLIGNARYIRRSAEAQVEEQVSRLDTMMARLTGRAR